MDVTIHYDITRLFSRAHLVTPTGQDRLDTRYANYIASNSMLYDLSGLFQHKGNILLISNALTTKLIKQMYDKWILNNCSDQLHKIVIEQCIEMLRVEILNIKLLDWVAIDKRLDLSGTGEKRSVYINVAFNGNDFDKEFVEYKKISQAKMLFFIHDLLPIEFPEYFRTGAARAHLQRIINLAKCADTIVPISRDVGKKLSELLQTLSIQGPKIEPIEPGVEEAFLTNGKLPNRSPEPLDQFVVVSTIEPRKNHLMLLEIWRDFLHIGLASIPKLYIVGRRGWNNDNVFSFLDNCISLKPHVIELTDAPDDKVMAILGESKAALFPSFGEGWGLPPVESLASGVTTICSDIPVLREATKGHAIYIHPNDHFGWRSKILEISRMSAANFYALNDSVKSFKPVVWDASFEKLKGAITECESRC